MSLASYSCFDPLITVILLLIFAFCLVLYEINEDNSVTLYMGKATWTTSLDSKSLLTTSSPGNVGYCFMERSRNSPLSDLSMKTFPRAWKEHSQDRMTKWLWNRSQIYDPEVAVLTENWHLPCISTKIKSWPLQLLPSTTPERSSGWTSQVRHSMILNSDWIGQEIDNFWKSL